MTTLYWIAALAYAIGIAIFLWVGFNRTRYHWGLVISISVLWLPAAIFTLAHHYRHVLWRYVPAVSRPWNPAYRSVWARMTHREKQISFLVDVLITLPAVILLVWHFA